MGRPQQVKVDLPNGLHVSIITDGYGQEEGLYEAYVTDDGSFGIADVVAGGDSDGIYGWLTPAKLGELLTNAAMMEQRTRWVLPKEVR